MPLSGRAPAFPQAADIVYIGGSLKKSAPHCGCGVFTASKPSTNTSFQFTGEQTIAHAELTANSFALGRAPPINQSNQSITDTRAEHRVDTRRVATMLLCRGF
jgi:hypothetical protein